MNNIKFCVLWKNRESVLSSIVKDTFTLGFLLLCIDTSRGSTWWTFFTTVIFLLFLYRKLSRLLKEERNVFNSKEEVRKWLDSIEE